MKRAALLLFVALGAILPVALVACMSDCPAIEPIPDAGAACSFAKNQEPLCSAIQCSVLGECCDMSPSGVCVAVCEPCCGAPDIVTTGTQGFQCAPVLIKCDVCPPGEQCHPCEAPDSGDAGMCVDLAGFPVPCSDGGDGGSDSGDAAPDHVT